MTFDEFVSRVDAKRNGTGHKAKCPAHADGTASLSINAGTDGRILLKCFAGCTTDAIVQSLGLSLSDLFAEETKKSRERITVGSLAVHKKLPAEHLRALGLRDLADGGIGIPYRDAEGNEVALKRRTALVAKEGSYWPKGVPLLPYGVDRLADARELDYLVIVEGESDCWTLWLNSIPALGIPGADGTKSVQAEHVKGITKVYFVREPDKGGDTFAAKLPKRLAELGYKGTVHELRLEGAKDPSELHQQDPKTFKATFEKAMAGATAPREDAGLATVKIADVADAGPVKWRVEGLWTDQAVGIIGGEPKSFKSFAAMQMGVCIASGKPMFGKFPTVQGRVLAFNAEDKPTTTRRRIEQMCVAIDVDFPALDLHLINIPTLRIDDEEQVTRLRATVAKLKPAMVILDPMRNLHGLDENDAKIVTALLSPLRLLQREYGCCVLLVHHMGKVGEVKRRTGQRLRGSSALHGWIDSALYLQEKAGKVLVEVEHRDAAGPDPFAFELKTASTERGDSLWLGMEDIKAEQSEADELMENRIISVLAASGQPMTETDIRGALRAKTQHVKAALQRLEARGIIQQMPVIKQNRQTYVGYFLTGGGGE